ncbi:MAG TPA: glycosyltransferase [Xanthobacteraceae bacterium]|nr:glycosyltransferase [Xanthobacteraceae bacterium]
MHALWITPGYPSAANPTGFVFHQTQARALTQAGIDVTVLAPTPWVPPGLAGRRPRWAAYQQQPRRESDGPIVVHRPRYLTTPRETRYGFAHLTQAFACRGASRPDVIHAHFAYPCGAAALRLKQRFGVPLLLSVLGDDAYIYPGYNRRMRRLLEEAVRGADHVIANSPDLAETTRALTGVLPEPLSIGVDLARFSAAPDRAKIRAELRIADDTFVVLYVGALLRQKGVLDLAEALRRVAWRDVVALFVGAGPVQPEGPGVRLLGPRANSEIPTLLAAADVFVLPSWHEGLGLSAVEAGAAGIPVIGGRTGGLANLLADDCGYAFTPRDVDALIEALRAMRADPGEARRRADRLKARVARDHDLHVNARRVAALYRELTERRKAAS